MNYFAKLLVFVKQTQLSCARKSKRKKLRNDGSYILKTQITHISTTTVSELCQSKQQF